MRTQYWVAGAGDKQLVRVRKGRWEVLDYEGDSLGVYRTRAAAQLAHPDVYEEGE